MWPKLSFVPLFLLLFILVSCGKSGKNGSGGLLPRAKGAPGEIIMVIDSSTYEGKVGDAVRKVFKGDIQWLSRPQSQFTLRVVEPREMNNVLRGSKNLVYVTVLNDDHRGNKILRSNFTKKSIARIKEDSSLFMFAKEDEFARGQEVVHLFGLNEDILVKNLLENRERIRKHFNEIEMQRTQQALFSAEEEKGIEAVVARDLDCKIRIPYGYEIAIQEDNFIWIRYLDPEIDRSVFITYTDYSSENQFEKENLIHFRDSVVRQHIFGDPENKESFMVTEAENFPVFHEQVNFHGKYAVQLRGLWKTNNLSMGGPFIGYAIVDEAQGRLYYIEGFLYSPGKKQREHVRELSAILHTFRTSEKNL